MQPSVPAVINWLSPINDWPVAKQCNLRGTMGLVGKWLFISFQSVAGYSRVGFAARHLWTTSVAICRLTIAHQELFATASCMSCALWSHLWHWHTNMSLNKSTEHKHIHIFLVQLETVAKNIGRTSLSVYIWIHFHYVTVIGGNIKTILQNTLWLNLFILIVLKCVQPFQMFS